MTGKTIWKNLKSTITNGEPDLMALFKSTSQIPMATASSYAPHPLIPEKSCRLKNNDFPWAESSSTQIGKRNAKSAISDK